MSEGLSRSKEEKVSVLRNSARGQSCLIRLPGVCNFDPATTVLAHLNGGGMALKKPDLQGAFGCSCCHDVVDGRARVKHMDRQEIELAHRQGVERTQNHWLENGLIIVGRPTREDLIRLVKQSDEAMDALCLEWIKARAKKHGTDGAIALDLLHAVETLLRNKSE
jgi:hypothetical protein